MDVKLSWPCSYMNSWPKVAFVLLQLVCNDWTHVNNVVRSFNFHLRALRHIRHSSPRDIANTTACCIVGSKLDYCNALLFDIPISTKAHARVVCGVSKFQRTSEDLLYELHWLPIRQRIHYKIVTITYRALHQQPTYISSYNWITRPTFPLGPFVPSVKDCSTHLVLKLLLAPDVYHLLLQSFGMIYLTTFDPLQLS